MHKYKEMVSKYNVDFVPIRKNHVVEFYENESLFIKVSAYNPNTRGFLSEKKILDYIISKNCDFVPHVEFYEKNDSVEILGLRKIEGEEFNCLDSKTIVILEKYIRQLFDIGVIHGDIKSENVLCANDKIYLIDFDQARLEHQNVLFGHSEDMQGNNGNNLSTMKNKLLNRLLKNLNSTGSSLPYYTWRTESIDIRGEREDNRDVIINKFMGDGFLKNKSVIDIGCNIGKMSHFASIEGASHVDGIESDINTAEAARQIAILENRKNISIHNMDLSNNVPEGPYDVAFCFSVLHHINPRKKVFDFLNSFISEFMIIETKIEEYPYNSEYVTNERKWLFRSDGEMLDFLMCSFSEFSRYEIIGETDRGRKLIVLWKK